jgi:hypothetical protein
VAIVHDKSDLTARNLLIYVDLRRTAGWESKLQFEGTVNPSDQGSLPFNMRRAHAMTLL